MAKILTVTHKDRTYTLEFTRKTVRDMENSGFTPSDLDNGKVMTTIPRLFAGAFMAHHRLVNQTVIDEIFDTITDKEGLLGRLVEMYNEPIETLLSEPEDGKGNANWTANW